MKISKLSLVVGLLAFVLSSCSTTKKVPISMALIGEWNIIEVDGGVVVPADNQPFPFIEFNFEKGTVNGSSGCNRFSGTYDRTAKAGVLSMSNLASTMMMCPNMELESKVLDALGRVRKYKKEGDRLFLYEGGKRPIVVLAPRNTADLSLLEGRWRIASVRGKSVNQNERTPYLEFDVKQSRVFGNAGCNRLNGALVLDEKDKHSLLFRGVATTRMACDQMELENEVLKAVNEVDNFKVLKNTLELYNTEGHLLLYLIK